MNYYPFHIGDFAAHTAHLSWEEDIAYRRMLDWYYLNEKALPLDLAKVARLIRMPKSLPAIEVVLSEFFVQSSDGWHNKRADEELTSMLAKQEQQATKDEHEADRMRRYRERRAAMFAALRAVQIVPAWDVPMKELQRLFDTHCNGPATDLQREQAIFGDTTATAIPTPTPTPVNTSPKGDETRKRGALQKPVDVCETVWQDFTQLRKQKRAPLTQTALDGIRREAEKAGLPLEDALAYCCEQGWQGFNAGWYEDRMAGKHVQAETTYQRSMRERMTEFAPGAARKPPGQRQSAVEFFNAIEVPTRTVEAIK